MKPTTPPIVLTTEWEVPGLNASEWRDLELPSDVLSVLAKTALTVSLMGFLLVASMSVAFSGLDSTEICTALATGDPPFAGAYLALISHVATPTARVYLPFVQYFPTVVVSVEPQEPSVGDVVRITLSGMWQSDYWHCPPTVAHDVLVVGNTIYVLAGVTYATPISECSLRPCPCPIYRWTVQEELENLSPGGYAVRATVVDLRAPETVSTAHTWFTVSP